MTLLESVSDQHEGGTKSPRLGPQAPPKTGSANGHDETARKMDVKGKVQSLTSQADLLASRGRYAEALPLVEDALRLEPNRADLYLGLGQCSIQLGKLEDAIHSFDQALRCEPRQKFAIRGKATALIKGSRWREAIVCLRAAQKLDPTNREIGTELSQCLCEQGIQRKAEGQCGQPFFRDALMASETHAPAYFHLGVEYSEAGEWTLAKEMFTKAVQYNAGYLEAWNNLGVAHRSLAEFDNAVQSYSMALKMNQNCQKTRENMAICLLESGCRCLQQKEFKRASSLLKEALSYNSKNPDIFFNLGVMYAEVKKFAKAKVHYELATHFNPLHSNAQNNLGVIHRTRGNIEAAIQCFERALQAEPKMFLAGKNLGTAFGLTGQMSEAIKITRTALETNPNDAELHNNLALLHRDQGDLEICLEHLDACLKLDTNNTLAWSNRLMTLSYPSERTREEVFEAHRTWGETLERRISVEFSSWGSARDKSSPALLRVGYISPDFYSHSVSYFVHSVLQHHDPSFVHVTCYSDVALEDNKTKLFRSFVPRWRPTFGLPDDEVAKLIHGDGIDILVDLTGHTGSNRLAMLARKPAPVIVTWVGYPHTTGLSRVDYRISDEHADPPACPGLTTERLVYLPECFLCYTPVDNPPPVGLRPAQETYGCVTFGCFNNLAKVSTLTIRLWCRVLQEVPDARLFLKSKALQCAEVQDKYRRLFAAHGIEPHRLDLSRLQPQTGSHLQMYSYVDVALDTAPYAGTTTTCEALYMGVPVISLRGQGIHAQSVGASLLNAVKLGDLVATTEDEYVHLAKTAAQDVKRLAALRAGLRTRMQKSVLCDGPRHTARLERLYAGLVDGRRSCGTTGQDDAATFDAQ